MEITEKVAYLRGLMEGLGIDSSTKEGKVLASVVDILDDIAVSVSDLESGISMVAQQMDLFDEELDEIHEEIFGDGEGCGCEDDDDYEGELYEVTCPTCGDTVCVDEDMLDEGEIECPGCGEALEFDLDGALEGLDSDE